MSDSGVRLNIQLVDSETVQVETTPKKLLFLVTELLGLAEGDPSEGNDTVLTSGVQLDPGSEWLLLNRVSEARSSSRYNDPHSPEKLDLLQFVLGYDGVQLNASKDGLIKLSGELILSVMSKARTSQLLPGKELSPDSLSLQVVLVQDNVV